MRITCATYVRGIFKFNATILQYLLVSGDMLSSLQCVGWSRIASREFCPPFYSSLYTKVLLSRIVYKGTSK